MTFALVWFVCFFVFVYEREREREGKVCMCVFRLFLMIDVAGK